MVVAPQFSDDQRQNSNNSELIYAPTSVRFKSPLCHKSLRLARDLQWEISVRRMSLELSSHVTDAHYMFARTSRMLVTHDLYYNTSF